ncbi:MAG TPA: VTT domain-containing protein [Ktedonobacteraceae bacterium]
MSSLITFLTDSIQSLYAVTGLFGIVLAMAIESCCIPLPSEIIMPLAGSMLAISSQVGAKHLLGVNPASPLWLNLLLLAFAGALGCLVGSLAAYAIGYAGGRPLMLKYGRYILISQHDADRADSFFQRWGPATAFFSRLLPVVRTYISLPAGISKMPVLKFAIYTFLGSLPWCFVLAYLGYQLGNHYEQISGPLHYVDGAIVVIVVVLLALYIWRHIRNDHQARAEHTAAEAVATLEANNPWSQPTFQPGQPPVSPQPSAPQPQWGQQPAAPQSAQPQWGQQPNPQSAQQQWRGPATPAPLPPQQGNNPGPGNGRPR